MKMKRIRSFALSNSSYETTFSKKQNRVAELKNGSIGKKTFPAQGFFCRV
jgi:hypothetical protein